MQQAVPTNESTASRPRHPRAGWGIALWFLGMCLFVYLIGPLIYFFFVLQWPIVPMALSDPVELQALSTS